MNSRLAAFIFGFATLLLVAVVFTTSPILLGRWEIAKEPSEPQSQSGAPDRVTESEFQAFVQEELNADPVRANIWRAARSDHRLLIHAFLACRQKVNEMANMPAELFSALLLDLTPSGSHVLPIGVEPSDTSSKSADINLSPTSESAGANLPVTETADERQLLSLSDSISRARLLSTAEVSHALPNAKRLWWGVLLVSGLATLFVTLQTKLRRPESEVLPPGAKPDPAANEPPGAKPDPAATEPPGAKPDPAANEPPGAKPDPAATVPPGEGAPVGPGKTGDTKTNLDAWYAARKRRRDYLWQKWGFEAVAFMAVALAITGTSLTALKQYYDPTRALVQNELASRELRKLHQEIVLAVTCKDGKIAFGGEAKMKDWSERMAKLQADIVPPYAATGGSSNQGDVPGPS